mgnify:CR=1 FL=1
MPSRRSTGCSSSSPCRTTSPASSSAACGRKASGRPDTTGHERTIYPFVLTLREEAAVISRMQAKQRIQDRRLTDTGHPGDGMPTDFGSTDLVGL